VAKKGGRMHALDSILNPTGIGSIKSKIRPRNYVAKKRIRKEMKKNSRRINRV